MAKQCAVTGKSITFGNHVSHANNRKRRTFRANLHEHRLFVPYLGRTVRMTLSAKGLRTIEKRGVDVVVRELVASGRIVVR